MIKNVSVEDIMKSLPDNLLDQFATETKVDYSVKKLKGKVLLQLFLYSCLASKRLSQRILSSIYTSPRFEKLFKVGGRLQFSSISMRLSNIKVDYFEKIFNHLFENEIVEDICFGQKKLSVKKLDSTFITLSSKLLKFGMDINQGDKNLKFGVMIEDGIPVDIKLFKENPDISDSRTFMAYLDKKPKKTLEITIFDRGMDKVDNYVALKRSGIFFVSRIKDKVSINIVSEKENRGKSTKTLKKIVDQTITFTRNPSEQFRLITAFKKDTNEKMRFITTIDFLSTSEITELYRSRWEIEVFFKFIKQELNFSHLLSRNENGIKATMYLTMIVAILLTLYKKANNLTNWVIIKMKFFDELEAVIIKSWAEEIFRSARDSVLMKLSSNHKALWGF